MSYHLAETVLGPDVDLRIKFVQLEGNALDTKLALCEGKPLLWHVQPEIRKPEM
jgi:hypothetical protein